MESPANSVLGEGCLSGGLSVRCGPNVLVCHENRANVLLALRFSSSSELNRGSDGSCLGALTTSVAMHFYIDDQNIRRDRGHRVAKPYYQARHLALVLLDSTFRQALHVARDYPLANTQVTRATHPHLWTT
jgi:hypothetical protein